MQITNVGFRPSTSADRARGLLGFCSFTLDDRYAVACVAVRRTGSGELRLSFPLRRDRGGRARRVFRPLDEATRLELERLIFDAIGLQDGVRLPR